jgi:UDP-N-acetylglucosamine--N-acetylmuramyl-(pentapeptide) pyrophosphoryl-undecaprenol N-acetylglucosamine transferase
MHGAPLDLLYVGVRGRVDETIVPRAGISFRAISAGPLRVSSPVSFVRNIGRLLVGVAQSKAIMLSFKPDVVFATGGYSARRDAGMGGAVAVAAGDAHDDDVGGGTRSPAA